MGLKDTRPRMLTRAKRRQSGLWQLAAVFVGLLVSAAAVSAQSYEVRLAGDSLFATDGVLASDPPAMIGHLPVLFVHGHGDNLDYRRNWQQALRGLPSFKDALVANAELGIEPYYIRFFNQNRSITKDALAIGEAIELILHRHDPNYPVQSTSVQVVVIAYSKGTLSSRSYLKKLDLARPGFHPVSEFIAISPPNHGINLAFGITCSGQQLMNGVRENCDAFSFNACNSDMESSVGFITNLNESNEAPGSRAPGPANAPNPPTAGTLYVTIYANNNRDFVGGESASTDCGGRRWARNLSDNAFNIEVAEVTDDGWETNQNPLLTEDEKRAVAIHENTVHTPEVICQALYAATHHRAPAIDLHCVPIIPPPSRAAAMLTLDFSGSMSLPTGPNATRASVLKDAVDLFVDLWSAVSVPSDSIGVTYFRTNVTQFPTSGGLLPLQNSTLIADVGGQVPSNLTAMGGGLQRAIEALRAPSVDAAVRRVILFTDGMQNVNPMVMSVGDHHEIIDQPGRPNSDVTPTNLRLDQLNPSDQTNPPDQLPRVAIDTIGIGASDLGLLQDIANETHGRSRVTTDIELLRLFFVEELIDALKGFSPQLVGYRRGSIGSAGDSSEAFAVEGGPHRAVLKLSWKRGDSMDFSVSKDGVDVTAAGRFIKGEFYKIFVIDLPKKGKNPIAALGNWQLRIKGKKDTAYETAAIVDGGRITYDAVFNAKQPKVGEPLDLVVRSTIAGKPTGDSANVTATLMIPTTTVGDLIAANPPKETTALEPGMSVAERHLLAFTQDPKNLAKLRPKPQTVALKQTDKGIFSTRLNPQVPGIYTAVVTIDGETAKIGKFSRTMTVTTVVRAQKPTEPETNKP